MQTRGQSDRSSKAGGWLILICTFLLLPLCFGGGPSDALAQSAANYPIRVYLPLIDSLKPIVPPRGDWLAYVNYYRALAKLPPLVENPTWSDGGRKHARYIVKTNTLTHSEDPASPWYTPEGDEAARSSCLAASHDVAATDAFAIDMWMQGPFHAVSVLDPSLLQVGYGSYRESSEGLQMGAALDVLRGRDAIPPSASFPVIWPADGETVPIGLHWGEYPSPLASCPGYSAPAGLPLILQLGPGDVVPNVTAHSFRQGSTPLEHCVFDATTYANPDAGQQSLGRSVLAKRSAVVLVPRAPLMAGTRYTASITADGSTHTWSFTVASEVQAAEARPEMLIR